MENAFTWEYDTLINELVQGMEKAKQLQFHLSSTSPSQEASDLLLHRIVSSYQKALFILNWKGSVAPESSLSVDGSSKSDELNITFNDHHQEHNTPKKRKLQPTWIEQVKVNPENGLEGPTDDGYSWRKYGQKDILGAKFPRSYYRCTYRHIQNCWATKQVQRSDDDQTVFEITYKGTHTCNQSSNAVPSPEKKESKHKVSQYHQQEQQNEKLSNLKANLKVRVNDEVAAPFSFPSTYDCQNEYFPISVNYFSPETHQMENLGGTHNYQHYESEIISAHASTTNSPIGSIEFPIDPVDLDTIFPFHTSGFFT